MTGTAALSQQARDVTPTAVAITLFDRLEQAWNLADGDAFGAVFTDDCDFVDIRGAHHQGAPAVRSRTPGDLRLDLRRQRHPLPGPLGSDDRAGVCACRCDGDARRARRPDGGGQPLPGDGRRRRSLRAAGRSRRSTTPWFRKRDADGRTVAAPTVGAAPVSARSDMSRLISAMPELPEVEITARLIGAAITGADGRIGADAGDQRPAQLRSAAERDRRHDGDRRRAPRQAVRDRLRRSACTC